MPKFSEYTSDMNLTPEVDTYVNELEQNKSTLKSALDVATTSEDYQTAYDTYYENSYGYLMDEAETHNVNVQTDKSNTTEAVNQIAYSRAKMADDIVETNDSDTSLENDEIS